MFVTFHKNICYTDRSNNVTAFVTKRVAPSSLVSFKMFALNFHKD